MFHAIADDNRPLLELFEDEGTYVNDDVGGKYINAVYADVSLC